MNVSVTFRQMDPSDALREYASRKLEHTVRKYIHAPIDAQATFHIEKFWHIATFNLQVRGIAIKTQEKSEDMYASVDLAMDKLERQLRRYKDKLRDHKPTKNVAGKRFEEQIIEPAPDAFVEEQEAAEAGAYDEAPVVPPASEFGVVEVVVDQHAAAHGHKHPKVVRSQVHDARPMGLGEAIMQLDLSTEPFLIFTNAETHKVNILYRREDGHYGLLDTNAS
jgi:putative sigma-54 modulation protein